MFPIIMAWMCANVGFVLLIIALIIATLQWSTQHKISSADIYYRWVALLPLGICGLYAFVMHAFYPELAAKAIGWENNPFQYEVAMANLGFGLIGVLSFTASYGFRLATVIGATCWLWGNASGHIYQIITHHNYTTGNAGSWLWLDIIVPLILIICINKLRPRYP